jgi:hypothetical protein
MHRHEHASSHSLGQYQGQVVPDTGACTLYRTLVGGALQLSLAL